MSRPTWKAMNAGYTAMLDRLAPVGPQDEISYDARRGAMKGAISGSWLDRRRFAATTAAASAESSGFPEADVRNAIRLWQSLYRTAADNARRGHLVIGTSSTDVLRVHEPISGMGVTFKPGLRAISSDGGAKCWPAAFEGRLADDDLGGPAEYFIGVGIGRWVYLHGAQLACPDLRWSTTASNLRTDSGSPYVRAWLHAQHPYRWAPVHDYRGHVSCQRCRRADGAKTEAAWRGLSVGADPRDHRLVPLPRIHFPPA